jgi:hypothetical protein
VQLNAIAGAFAPTVAGDVIVLVAPAVTTKDAVPTGILQARATEPGETPAVATLTATVPDPPVNVVFVKGLIVGADDTGATSLSSTFVVAVLPADT